MAAEVVDERGVVPGRGLLAVACVSTLVVNANTSAVSILLPSISADVGTPVEVLQWAVTGYLLVGAAVIVTVGALGDVFGRRRLFVAGLALFVVSCVFIALATTGPLVVVGRVVQGAAGSTLLACGLSLLSVGSSGPAQMRAVALWGAAAAAGAALGPVLGGVLDQVASWQGLFWVDAAVAAALVPLTLRSVTESRDGGRPRQIDWLGTVLIAAVLVPFVFAMTEGSTWGWASFPTVACLVLTGAAGIGFVAAERHVTAPLVDLGLLRNVRLVASTIAILIGAGAIAAVGFLLSLYLQDPATLDMSSLTAGLASLPLAVVVVAIAPAITPLTHRFGTRSVVLVGFAILIAAFVVLAGIRSSWGYGAILLPLLGIAVGLGLTNGPASSVATACVSRDQVGQASGISNMARYVGGAVMTAVVAGIYADVTATNTAAGASPADAVAAAMSRSSVALAAFAVCGVLVGVAVSRRSPRPELLDYAAAAAATTHDVLSAVDPPRATGSRAGGAGEP